MLQLAPEVKQRFIEKIELAGDIPGCWIWTSALNNKGYGFFRFQGKVVLAHRLAYEYWVGPIPEGLELDHVKKRGCRSTACVRPDHLQPVTHAENCERADTFDVGAAQRAMTHCGRGHAFDEANTYWHGGKRHCRTCRRERAAAHT